MTNEPIICKKCAHRQFEGTHCDFCGSPLFEKPARKKRMTKFAWLRIAGFACVLAVFFVYFSFFRHAPPPTPIDPTPVTLFPAQQSGVLNKVMQTAAETKKSDAPSGEQIFAQAAPGIVTLYQDDSAGTLQHVIGAGFLLDNTAIATNYHVVHGIADISARFGDGTVRKVSRVLNSNQQHDVALLQIDQVEDSANQQAINSLEAAGRQVNAAGLTSAAPSTARTAASGLNLGRTAALNVGDAVIAAGTPTGLGGSLAQGIVTGMPGGLLKTNLPVSSSWSGGPLLNMQGEVVGMLTSQPPSNLSGNYALPIEWATSLQQSVDTTPGSPSGATGSAKKPSHGFGPYSFKLAAMQKRSLPFTTPADLENAQFSARLTAPAAAHLHITITHQGRVMYDSGDTAGAHFTLSLKRGEYVMLVENSSKSASSDVAIAGTFSNDL